MVVLVDDFLDAEFAKKPKERKGSAESRSESEFENYQTMGLTTKGLTTNRLYVPLLCPTCPIQTLGLDKCGKEK